MSAWRIAMWAPLAACAGAEPLDTDSSDTDMVVLVGLTERPVSPTCLPPEGVPAPVLSATGCVDPDHPRRPADGVMPYVINAPFWSDGVDKERFVTFAATGVVDVVAGGGLALPVGTAAMKTFSLGGAPFETRLLWQGADGWSGASYLWRGDGSDADLVDEAGVEGVLSDGRPWTFPGRDVCLDCHTRPASYALGLELPQLARDHTFDNGVTEAQLDAWERVGLFAAPLAEAEPVAPLPDPYGAAPVEDRARAWLHVNCAPCHRPAGGTRSLIDLRWTTTLANTFTCDRRPSFPGGPEDGVLLAPGEPERSVLVYRARATDPLERMPPVGVHVADDAGIAVVEAWITALESCP